MNRATARPRQTYLPGLDGIRALAVLAVMLFHSAVDVTPGGFLGVEVFFVISGFIITCGLLRERERHGSIDLGMFWKRRALRLLPALALLLLAVLGYAEWLKPEIVAGLRGDALAAMGYVTNWYYIAGGQSYFDSFAAPSLLLHLWSLAIEEQFYLLWPLLFAASAWLGGRRTLFGVALAGAIASATWMALLHADGTNTTRLYYGTDTRASGLLLGAALAAAWTVPANAYPAAARRLLDIAGGAALLALAGFALLITEDSHFLYAGGFFAVDLLTAVLIVAVVAPGGLVARGLSASPLRWVGLRSYGLYLWHWPVMLVFTPSFGSPAGPYAALVLQLAVSGVLAAASYRLLEQPIRRGALGRLWARARQPGLVNRLGYASGLGSIAAAVLAVGMVASTAGPEEQPPYFAMESYRVLNPVVPTEFDVAPPMDSDVSGVSYYGPRYESDVSDDPWVQELGRAMRGEQPAAGEPKVIYSPQEEMELVTETTLLPREPSAATRAGILVTAIGDSVMLGAAPAMAAQIEGLDVDAAVSRAMVAAIGELERRAANDTLADVVVVHIGNNGPIDDEEIDRIASIVGSRKTFFVNLRVPRAWEAENNAVLERAAERYANFELIDWRDVSEAHPEILWTDGIHLRPSGASVYVEMIIAALER